MNTKMVPIYSLKNLFPFAYIIAWTKELNNVESFHNRIDTKVALYRQHLLLDQKSVYILL